jgi:hypothetical protein
MGISSKNPILPMKVLKKNKVLMTDTGDFYLKPYFPFYP